LGIATLLINISKIIEKAQKEEIAQELATRIIHDIENDGLIDIPKEKYKIGSQELISKFENLRQLFLLKNQDGFSMACSLVFGSAQNDNPVTQGQPPTTRPHGAESGGTLSVNNKDDGAGVFMC